MRRRFPVTRKKSVIDTDPLLAGLRGAPHIVARSFRGRTVVVTGGASGIGRAIAFGFGLAGARVIILDYDRAKGRATLAQLRRCALDARFLAVDLRDLDAVERAAKVFAGKDGADILINNAAMAGRLAPFPELTRAECESVLRANLLGPMELARLAAKRLIARGAPGAIINVLTIQTLLPVPAYAAYIASKGGLEALTLAMAVDLAPHGIRVNGLRVGSVLTDNYLRVLPEKLKRQMAEAPAGQETKVLDQRAATLLGRMGRPAEIAQAALFLASEEAGFVTGSILRADGGRAISRRVEPLL